MARELKPVFTGDALAPIPAGLEILMVEAKLLSDYSLDPGGSEAIHMATWLVTLDPTVAQRRAARALAAGLVAAHANFHQAGVGVSLDRWLPDLLMHHQESMELCVVISVPAYNLQLQAHIEQFIGQLRLSKSHCLQHVVSVSPQAADWQNCNAFTGHVECDIRQLNATAFKVFHLLNALQAPGQITALDAADYREMLGSALRPAALIEAVWTPQAAVLFLGSQKDKRSLLGCKKLLVMPGQELRAQQLADLYRAVQRSTVNSCTVVIVAPYGQHTQATASSEIIPVSLLCSDFIEVVQR